MASTSTLLTTPLHSYHLTNKAKMVDFAGWDMPLHYGSIIEEGDSRHQKIEELDNQKPIFDGLSIAMVFPIIYYHAKYLQMERWLNQ